MPTTNFRLATATQWDDGEGPFTWNEFVEFYGDIATARRGWLRAALERRYDSAAAVGGCADDEEEGPFSWAEFVRFYGDVATARPRWLEARVAAIATTAPPLASAAAAGAELHRRALASI